MDQVQFFKFSPITVAVKKNVRQLRLNAGYSMKTSLDELVGEIPEDYYSEFYVRPRKRLGSKSR